MRYVPDGSELDALPHVRLGRTPVGRPPSLLTLGTAPGMQPPPALNADTTTGMVLRLLRSADGRRLLGGAGAATCADFSGDHLLALWALTAPDAALARAGRLTDTARAAEFGVCRSEEVAQIACFLRAYPEEAGIADAGTLFTTLLPQVQRLLDTPRELDLYWIGEYSDVLRANHLLHSGAVQIDDYPELDLTVMQTPLRLHELTRLTAAAHSRLLTVRSENTYLLEYRRESWVRCPPRPTLPRIDLRPLAQRLNFFERAPGSWWADPPDEPVSLLFLDDGRGVASPSRLAAETVIAEVVDYLRAGAHRPQLRWSPRGEGR